MTRFAGTSSLLGLSNIPTPPIYRLCSLPVGSPQLQFCLGTFPNSLAGWIARNDERAALVPPDSPGMFLSIFTHFSPLTTFSSYSTLRIQTFTSPPFPTSSLFHLPKALLSLSGMDYIPYFDSQDPVTAIGVPRGIRLLVTGGVITIPCAFQ